MASSLDTTFRALCRDFFPRWRASTSWTIVEGPHGSWVDAQGDTHTTSECGYCDGTTKTIYINDGRTASQDYRLVIIHESCHAVTSGGHGKRFCTRLWQAAQRARDLGDMPLSAQLLEEADAYEQAPGWRISPYRRIPDILCDCPAVTFEQVLTYLASEYCEPAPLLRERYPRLRAVYDRTRRQDMTSLRYQLQTLRRVDGAADMVAYCEERLRVMEAVQN